MSIATELVDMETFINDAYNAAEENGATMPTQKNLQNLKPTIESIEGGGSGTDLPQVINYTMLYDGSLGEAGATGANTCPDVTGGYTTNVPVASGYIAGTLNHESTRIYGKASQTTFSGTHYISSSTVNKIDMNNYAKVSVVIKPNITTPRDGTYFNCSIVENNESSSALGETHFLIRDQHLVDNSSLNGIKSLASLDLSETTLKEFHLAFQGTIVQAYKTTEVMLYNAFLSKQDNWQELCTIAGLNSSNYSDEATLCANSTAMATILNNEEAVEYMIYNCTGTLMLEFIKSSTALAELNNSTYKTLIQANEHWNKFLNMIV